MADLVAESITVTGAGAPRPRKQLSCDEVAWLCDALDRFADIATAQRVGISRARQTAKIAALLEIMDILDYQFMDNAAAGNALALLPEFDALRGAPRA